MLWTANGFWGQDGDWDFCREALWTQAGLKLKSFNLLEAAARPPEFLAWLSGQDPHPIFMGYSMGARVGLEKFLLAKDSPFKAAILVAPHLGLDGPEAAARVEADEQLAQKFLGPTTWAELSNFWNSRDIFGGFHKERSEEPDSRPRLARELRELGLGRQSPLLSRMHELSIPLLWVVGEKDHKFRGELARAQGQNPLIQGVVIAQAAHRVHWEAPASFTQQSLQFLLAHFKGKRGHLC